MNETKFFQHMVVAIGCCLFLSLTPGCGSDEGEGVAPGISNLSLEPASFFVPARGMWLAVTVSMDYVDPDGDLAFVRMSFQRCGEGPVEQEDLAPTGITGDRSGVIWLSPRLPTDCPSGTYPFEFTAFDRKGHQSNTLDADFSLTVLIDR